MSGTSNVGGRGVYEAGDQTNYSEKEIQEMKEKNRYHEGKQNSHLANDSKDERSIANKLAREGKRGKEGEDESEETMLSKKDATLPAKDKGNEPSKGAKIDQELREEEAEILKKKGSYNPQ